MNEIKITSGQIQPLLQALERIQNLGETLSCYIRIKVDEDTTLVVDDGTGDAIQIQERNYAGTWGAPPTKAVTRRNQCMDDILVYLRKDCITLAEIGYRLGKPKCMIEKYASHRKSPRPGTLKMIVTKFVGECPELVAVQAKYPEIFG